MVTKSKNQIKRVHIFYREDNPKARAWNIKIREHIKRKWKTVRFEDKNPQAVIILGGDGTILEAARTFKRSRALLLGLNLGNVGFIASARDPKKFLPMLDKFFQGNYKIAEKMMLSADVLRRGKTVFTCDSLNEISVQNPLGMVNLQVHVEDHPVQSIFGTGVMIATASGSTAFNISAHGPIVMPDIRAFILTEIMDHDIPTPSIVVNHKHKIFIEVVDFREKGLLSISNTGQKVDVMLVSDGDVVFPLKKGDIIKVQKSPRLIRFAEFEKHYFFKSLQSKFKL